MGLNGFLLSDINECDLDVALCDHVCENAYGHFTCGCRDGYILKLDGKTCESKSWRITVQYKRHNVPFSQSLFYLWRLIFCFEQNLYSLQY